VTTRSAARAQLRVGVRGVRAGLRALGSDRPLPNFIIIGAQRCGTTSMYLNLCAHPQLAPPLGKELQYFTLNHRRSLDWYRGHFPVLGQGQQTFEATPYYLFHPSAPQRVAAALPDTKFVVMLRDPVERAISHYLHTCRVGAEPLSFQGALAAEPERMEQARHLGLDTREGHQIFRLFSYASRGLYAAQLERWLALIPRSRVHIIVSEQFRESPPEVFESLLDFLELDAFTPPSFAQHSRRAPGSSTQVPPAVRERLREHFSDDAARLARIIDGATAW
jgi:Sulfotransferase domain